MLRLYYGHLGSGKTYHAVRDAYKAIMRGDDVFTNFYFKPPKRAKGNAYQIDLNDFWSFFDKINYKNKDKFATVVLDEGWVLLDSYQTTKFPLQRRIKLASLRKHQIDLILTSQRPSAVHASARGFINEFKRCKKIISLDKIGLVWFQVQQFELDGKGDIDMDNPIRGHLLPLKRKIANSYDTLQDIRDMQDQADSAEVGDPALITGTFKTYL